MRDRPTDRLLLVNSQKEDASRADLLREPAVITSTSARPRNMFLIVYVLVINDDPIKAN